MDEVDAEICNECGERKHGDMIFHLLFCYDVYVVSAPEPQNTVQKEIDEFIAERIVKPLEDQGYKCFHGCRNMVGGELLLQAMSYPITIIPTTIVPIYRDKKFAAIRNLLLRADYLDRIVFLSFDSTKLYPSAISKNSYSINVKDGHLLQKLIQTIDRKRIQIPLHERKRKHEMGKDPESTICTTPSEFPRTNPFKTSVISRISFRKRSSSTMSVASEEPATSSSSEFPEMDDEVSLEDIKKSTSPNELLCHCHHRDEKIRHFAAKALTKIIQKDIITFCKTSNLQNVEKEVRCLADNEYKKKCDWNLNFEKLYFWILAAIYIKVYKFNDSDLKTHVKSLTIKKYKPSQKQFEQLCQKNYNKLTTSVHSKIKTWPKSLDSNDMHIKQLEICISLIEHKASNTVKKINDINAMIKYLTNLPWDIKHIFVVIIIEKIFEKKYTDSSMYFFSQICDSVGRKHREIFLDVVERTAEHIQENYTKGTVHACLKLLTIIWDMHNVNRKKDDTFFTILKHFFIKLVYHPLIYVRNFVTPLLFCEDSNSNSIHQLGGACLRVDEDLVETCIREKLSNDFPDMILNKQVQTALNALIFEGKNRYGNIQICTFNQKTLNDILQTNSTDDAYERFQEMSRAIKICQGNDYIVRSYNMPSNGIPPFYVTEHGIPLLHFLHEKENQLTWSQMMGILISITKAVQHCHKNFIILCDINPGSFMVFPEKDGSFQTKLASFLYAKCILSQEDNTPAWEYIDDIQFLSFKGDRKEPVAVYFSPPETLKDKEFSIYAETWMLNATFYSVLLYGRQPFQELAHLDAFHFVKEIISCHKAEIPSSFPPDLWKILSVNLDFDKSNRMLVGMLLEELETYKNNLGVTNDQIYAVKSVCSYIDPEDIQRGYVDINGDFKKEEMEEEDTRMFTDNFVMKKKATWSKVLSSRKRLIESIKKRWGDCYRFVKNKMSEVEMHARGTGGVPLLNITFNSCETILRQNLSSMAVEGVPGDCDTGNNTRLIDRLYETVTVRMNLSTSRKIKALNHENILHIEEIQRFSFTTTLVSYPFGEYSRTLDMIDTNTSIDQLLSYLEQITVALQYLHSQNILHCDLRCSYVYVNSYKGTLKLGHFGRAVSLEGKQIHPYVFKVMPPDAIKWSAPEVKANGMYSRASDIFNLAVVFWDAVSTQKYFPYYNPLKPFQECGDQMLVKAALSYDSCHVSVPSDKGRSMLTASPSRSDPGTPIHKARLDNGHHRCQPERLWNDPGSPNNTRPLDHGEKSPFNQHLGNKGHLPDISSLVPGTDGDSRKDPDRQYENGHIHQPSSRNPKLISLNVGSGEPSVSGSPCTSHLSSPNPRQEKGFCRLSKLPVAGPRNWKLNKQIFDQIAHHWGLPSVDIMTSHETRKVPLFSTKIP
ncbi:uncharacterized protein WCC33_012768 [Rhinophrynus dorsalis]